MGIIKNSPNALPWLILYIFVFLAFKYELVSGIIITLMGIFSTFAFDAFEEPFVFLVISLPLIILGSFLILNWYLNKKNVQKLQKKSS